MKKPAKPVKLKSTTADVAAVPCPHCGKASDLRGFRDMGLLEQDATVDCTHCNRSSVIKGVAPTSIVVWGTSTGPMQQIRCPSCKRPEDMTEIAEMGLLEAGNTVTCEQCHATAPIRKVVPQTLVTLVPRRA